MKLLGPDGKTIELRDDVVTSVAVTVALAKTIDDKICPGFFNAFRAHAEHVYRAAEDATVPNIADNVQVLSMTNFFCNKVMAAELNGEYGLFSNNQDDDS